MTAQYLMQLIQQGEGYNLEFKLSVPSKASELAEEICAFANAAGGTLLIGVGDKGNIAGIKMDNTSKSRLQNILNCIEPHYPVKTEEVELDGKTILCIHCESGEQKPYTVSGSIILRNGPNSEKITSVQRMRDFFQQSDRLFFDEALCKDFKYPEDFDTDYFSIFREAAGISDTIDTETTLENLKLFAGNRHFKNGAVLFFGKRPGKFYDWATTRCTLFKGTDKGHIIDDKIFDGNLTSQFDEALKYIYSKMNVEYEIKDAGPRKEIWEIPDVALKEALLNALTHRDYYERGARTTIGIFDDRIEITNPGGLVNSIPKADFGKRSLSRNSLIFGLFLRLNMVEQIGSGISRMKKAMADTKLEAPVFTLEGMFSVTFFRPISVERLIEIYWSPFINESQTNILKTINRNNKISKRELGEEVQLGKTSIDNNIEKLKDLGILERIGSDRGGSWKIIPKRTIAG